MSTRVRYIPSDNLTPHTHGLLLPVVRWLVMVGVLGGVGLVESQDHVLKLCAIRTRQGRVYAYFGDMNGWRRVKDGLEFVEI